MSNLDTEKAAPDLGAAEPSRKIDKRLALAEMSGQKKGVGHMKVDPSKFDYVMYVDASGDDGFKFDKDSSSCYCAAALLTKQLDIAHNLAILDQIKKIVGCKPTDEVKYSKVRRHRRGKEALELLQGIKGRMSCYIVFKKELAPGELQSSGLKELSVLCHAMALRSMKDFGFSENEKILIAIDRMKNTEEVPLGQLLTVDAAEHPERKFSYEVVFRDSKDVDFLLIQIADLLCGTLREHFEQYESNEDMKYFASICPQCFNLRLAKRKQVRALCKNGKSRAARIMHSKNLYNLRPLLPDIPSWDVSHFLFMQPIKMIDKNFYLFCKKM